MRFFVWRNSNFSLWHDTIPCVPGFTTNTPRGNGPASFVTSWSWWEELVRSKASKDGWMTFGSGHGSQCSSVANRNARTTYLPPPPFIMEITQQPLTVQFFQNLFRSIYIFFKNNFQNERHYGCGGVGELKITDTGASHSHDSAYLFCWVVMLLSSQDLMLELVFCLVDTIRYSQHGGSELKPFAS